MVKCTKCGETKPLDSFYKDRYSSKGHTTACSKCHKERYLANSDRIKTKERQKRAQNIEKHREYDRKRAEKKRSTPQGRLNNNMRRGISNALDGMKAGHHWENLVGYTLDQLKQHIEKKFKLGMTWDNYGKLWHIDHKIPISAFNFEKPEDIDFKKCWNLKNLQPMEAKENMKKHNKLEKPFQPSLTI